MTKALCGILVFIISVFPCRSDFAWAKWLSADSSSIVAVAADNHGNSYVAGTFSGQLSVDERTLVSAGGADIFVAKLNRAGEVTWAISGGGTNDDAAFTIAATSDGTIFVTGSLSDGAMFNGESRTPGSFLARISRRGAVDWLLPLTNVWAATAFLDQKRRLWIAGSEDSLLTLSAWNRKGEIVSNIISDVSGFTPKILKLDRTGDFFLTGTGWATSFGTNILSGDSRRSVLTTRITHDGASQWAHRITFSHLREVAGLTVSRKQSVALYGTAANGFYPGGPVRSGPSGGYPSQAIFDAGYSSAGEFGGIYFFGQYKASYEMNAVTMDRRGQTFRAGYFYSSYVGGTPIFRAAAVDGPGFVAYATNTARFMSGWQEGTISSRSIISDSRGHVYLAGQFTGSAFFGTNRVGVSLNSSPQGFVTRLDLRARKRR